MRTWLGRLIRDIQRKIAGNEALEAAFKVALERAETIFGQQPDDKAKLYALSAPEVECIGKGKARTRYEFGVKTAIATTNERARGGQFVLGIMALPGAPYDGHTLAGQIHQVGKLTGVDVKRAYVDHGYRGHKIQRDGLAITISQTRGIASATVRRERRRRSSIEPVIGHLTHDGLLERNHLAGPQGDAIPAPFRSIWIRPSPIGLPHALSAASHLLPTRRAVSSPRTRRSTCRQSDRLSPGTSAWPAPAAHAGIGPKPLRWCRARRLGQIFRRWRCT